MKTHKNWSYAPYRPPFVDCGDIYICRVAPEVDSIVFDWLDIGAESYDVYCRQRNQGEFEFAQTVNGCTALLTELAEGEVYEFYVAGAGKKSRVRLAKCGAHIDTVVNYLHPEDTAYDFSGKYLCSPSLVRHPDGYLLASMDLFKGNYPQNLSLIYRSDDEGKTWKYVSELFPCFWGRLFIHKGELYMLAVNTEYGDLLIGKSVDGGVTFTEPTVLLRGGNGKNGEAGVHKNPQPVVEYNGRLWNTLEWGAWGRGYHAAMVMSVPVGADLLEADNWSFSEPVKYDPTWPGVPEGNSPGNIEGTLVKMRGGLHNVMRYQMGGLTPNYGLVLAYKVNTEDPEAPLEYSHAIPFPANHSKFEIHYCEATGKYYSIASRILDSEHITARNLLSLFVSEDAEVWTVDRDLVDMRDSDMQKIGFQYVDAIIEGDEMLYLCRTAMNGAANFHDSNYSTFGRIKLK